MTSIARLDTRENRCAQCGRTIRFGEIYFDDPNNEAGTSPLVHCHTCWGGLAELISDGNALYIKSNGKHFKVTAVFNADAEANAHMERHPEQSCISAFGPVVVVANNKAEAR